MKQTLIILGSVFVAIIILGGAGFGFVAMRGKALDRESKAYADTAVPAIVNGWNEKELVDRASLEFKKAATQNQLDQLFRWFSSLGRFQTCEPAQGEALMSMTSHGVKTISAQYTTKVAFEKGGGTVTLALIKHDDQWQILRFDLRSPQLPRR